MRALYYIIGTALDLLVLAAGGGLLVFAIRPELMEEGFYLFLNALEGVPQGRLMLAGAGVALIMFSLRLVLFVSGKKEEPIYIKRGEGGSVALSRHAAESFLQNLMRERRLGRLRKIHIDRRANGIAMTIQIELDFASGQMPQRAQELDAVIKERFRDDLGLEIAALDVRVEFGRAEREEQGAFDRA